MAFWKRGTRTTPPTVSVSSPSLIQALEPRMMFDASVPVVADQAALAVEAAAAAAGHDPASSQDAASEHDPAPATAAPATASADVAGGHEVVFIDSAVSDYQKLIAGLPEGVEVVVLDNSKDGLKQIADYLDGRKDIASIDIISHGDAGYIYLAGDAIWTNQLDAHAADLARIGTSLAEGGDVRFFACNTGAGAEGQQFVNEVSRLTGADVGASNDSTGNRAGEDWQLETVAGAVASGVGVQRGDLSAFTTSLATITVTDTDASSTVVNGKVSLAEAIQAANGDVSVDGSAAGSGSDIIVFHQDLKGQTIRWSSATALAVTSTITINGDVDGDGVGDIILSGDVNNNGTREALESSGLAINSGALTVRNLDFRGFSGNINGGALRANGGALTVEDSNFQNNSGTVINSTTAVGTAITLRNSTLHDNSSTIVGATAMSSLVRLAGNGSYVLENVAIYNNSGTHAGGGTVASGGILILNSATVQIVNSTIANNVFTYTGAGGISSAGLGWTATATGLITVQNTIISGNTVNSVDANLQAGTAYTNTTNLIGTTVNFVDAANGDLRLAASASNAINLGTSAGAPITDLRGFERPRGGAVDIGAYEVLYDSAPLVDLDSTTGGNDSSVDFNGSAVTLLPNIVITQSDGDTQVSGASLSLSGSLDGNNEVLLLSAGQLATAASYGISVTGSGTSTLALSGVATLAQYRAVLAAVQYSNSTPAYTAGTRSVTVRVNDDMGSTARTALVVVQPLNAAPVIGNLNGDSAAFTQGGGAVLIDAGGNATVSDSDSTDFAGGALTVSVTANAAPGEDRLAIRNQGNGAGQIGVSGSSVSYGGTVIGTLSGGTGGSNLVVSLNANANAAAVEALVRNLTYDNSNASNAIGQANRMLSVTVSDGDGATSSVASVTVTVRETVPPTATIVVSDSTLLAGETTLVSITFSEAVSGLTVGDFTVANGVLSNLSSGDGGITWTATLTPSSATTDSSNLISLNNAGVTDAAGNAGVGTTESNNYAIDTERPTAVVSLSSSSLLAGQTAVVTITFSEAVSGFTLADLSVSNGALTGLNSSDGGITWTALLTPTAASTSVANVVSVNLAGVADLSGNAGTGSAPSPAYSVDTARPTASIVVADTALRAGETSLVTITFSEAVTGFSNVDLSVANGSLSSVSSSDGGITWTATFTPDADITSTGNLISLANSGVSDQAGNTGIGITDSNSFAIDTQRPTATIVVVESTLGIGESSIVTVTFSEPVSGFTRGDLSVSGGTLSNFLSSDGGVTWIGNLSPDSNISTTGNVIVLNNTGVADLSGNNGSGTTDSNTFAVDTQRPTAVISMADTALSAGESTLVTFTFSEAVNGFDNSDVSVVNGTLGNVVSSDGGITWTALFTPTLQVQDGTNLITLNNSGITDLAGNSGTGTTNSPNYTVNTVLPTATIVVADTALAVGETSLVTITFSEAVSGFTNADLSIANGTLSTVSSSDGGITWTATFTPSSNVDDSTNLITLDNTGVMGASGNTGIGSTDSNNFAIDTQRPTATIVVADNALSIGETSTVTITFSEAVSGFTTADLNVTVGLLSNLSSSDGGVTWTATLTPTSNIANTSNVVVMNNAGVADLAGNNGSGTTDSNTFAVDTQRPTAVISMADRVLSAGESTLVTFTFSEAVNGFDNSDVSVANGTLSNVTSNDGGITWTALFTPALQVQDISNLITLNNSGITDLAGNSGTGTTNSPNYTVNTVLPTATIVVADTALAVGETSLVTITFSEAVSGFTNADLSIANGTLSTVSSSDGGITWTATFTPSSNVDDSTNLITLDNTGVMGASGNTGIGSTDSNNFAIDTQRPTATIVVADNALSIGETSTVTITFSEAVSGFTTADLNVTVGLLSNLSSSDGGVTWTATLTPTSNIANTSNVVVLNNAGVTDQAGNSGIGSTDSNTFAVDTQRPTSTIVLSDSVLTAGQTSQVTITFSEAVTGLALDDFSVSNGLLSNLSSSDGGVTWTATFTPASNVEQAGNLISLDNSRYTDLAGNSGTGSSASPAFSIDTVRPNATIVVADSTLTGGESSLVTITFNEPVSGLTLADFSVTNGALTNLSSSDGGITWTATLTPTAGVEAASNLVSLNNAGVTDQAGNSGVGSSVSNAFAVDSRAPTVAVSSVDSSPNTPDSVRFTVTFSEAVNGVDLADFALLATGNASGTLSSLQRLDANTYVVTVSGISGSGNLSLNLNGAASGIADQAGNALSGGITGGGYNVDRVAPVTTGVTVPVGVTYSAGDNLSFVVNTSETVLVNGTPQLALDIGGRTVFANYVAGSGSSTLVFQYTVQAGDNDANGIQVVGLSSNGGSLRDAAGNAMQLALNNVADSSGVTVDTDAPQVESIVAAPSAPGSMSFTVTFSEAVNGVQLSDFSLLTTGNASGSLQSLVQIDARTWQVNVIGTGGSGSLALALNGTAGTITDNAGNPISGGFSSQGQSMVANDGDPEFRANAGVSPLAPAQPLLVPQVPLATSMDARSPLLPAPLFEVPTLGNGVATLGSIFIHNGALAPSYLAQVFASSSSGAPATGGVFGLAGSDGNAFGSSSLASIFSKTMPDDGGQYELSGGKPWRQGGEGGAGRGMTSAPSLGQQLQGITDNQQRPTRELAQALGQINARVPQV
ncbi:MAG: Ig-like domain-containing protein [Pseudomonas shirazensis]